MGPTMTLRSRKIKRAVKAARTGTGSTSSEDMDDTVGSEMDEVLRKAVNTMQDNLQATVAAGLETLGKTLHAAFDKQLATVKMHLQAEIQEVREDLEKVKTDTGSRVASEAGDLSNQVAALTQKIEFGEQSARARNVILFNVSESSAMLETVVRELLPISLHSKIAEVSRIGRAQACDVSSPPARPVRVCFTTVQAKHDALKSGKAVRAKGASITLDLTPAQQQTKRSKWDRYAALKHRGFRPFWRTDKLF